MPRRLIAVFLLVWMGLPAFAQLKLHLEFPSAGKYQVWAGPKAPSGKLPETTGVEGQSGDVSPGEFGPGDKLFVLDEGTGNLATKPISEIKGSWKLTTADFSTIGRVTVRVEHKGEPVESASIDLKSGKDARTQLLDSSSQGEASFYGVSPGQVQVAVRYKTKDGETPDPIKQSTEVKLDRTEPEVTIVVSIQDDVATATPVTSGDNTMGGGQTKEEPAERGGLGIFGRIISFLLALGVAVLLVYFGFKWMKSNQDTVQSKLQSLGVEVPGQTQEPPADAYKAQAPIAPPPPEKIILDDAAPAPLSPGVAANTAVITGDPRLVSEDGDQIPLDEGTLTVGRDAGMGLSLLNESTVSRNHAELVRSGQTVRLRDLGSTNGTYVNGSKVMTEVELRPGDKVQFGAVKFRFEG